MTPTIEQLEKLLAEAEFTRLQADWIPAGEGQEEGWRIHDMPDEPAWIADFICGGMEEAHAKLFVAAVNSLPSLIAQIKELREALEHHYQQDLPFYERQLLARKALGAPE